MTQTAKTTNTTQKVQRTFQGVVVSTAENKTVHVKVETIKMHPKYKKQYKTHKKYAVHDETNQAGIGDVVKFKECRPLSKTKRWRLTQIMKKAA